MSKYSTKRKTDTTLIYLHHARHADEHGLEPVTSERIKSWAVGGSGLVRELVIGNGQVKKFDASPGIELKVAVGLVPAAVVNRGVKYEPPIGATLASLAQDGQPV